MKTTALDMALPRRMELGPSESLATVTGWLVGTFIFVVVAAAAVWAVEGASSTAGLAVGRSPQQGQLALKGPVESVEGKVLLPRRLRRRPSAPGGPLYVRSRQFLLQGETEVVTVLGGPPRYRRRQGFEIRAGDELQVKGWRLTSQDRRVIIAGEIKRGSAILKLRDDRGNPLWLRGGRGPVGAGRQPSTASSRIQPQETTEQQQETAE